ncbi:hypothetical protein ACJX0J_013338 [Zea mays]
MQYDIEVKIVVAFPQTRGEEETQFHYFEDVKFRTGRWVADITGWGFSRVSGNMGSITGGGIILLYIFTFVLYALVTSFHIHVTSSAVASAISITIFGKKTIQIFLSEYTTFFTYHILLITEG